MLRAVKIPAYIPSPTQRAGRRSDLARCCCWNQKKISDNYLMHHLYYVVLIPTNFTGMVDNGNTCQLFHASVNTLAGMGRFWFDVNATSATFLLYCHSLPVPPVFLLCFHQVLIIFLPTPCPFMFLFCSGSCFASNWDVVAGKPAYREACVLPAQCEHTCTYLQVFWPKGKVLKSRCYQFYKGVLFWVVTVGYCLSRSSTKCDIMQRYVMSCYLLPKMSLFPNQQGQTGLLLPLVAFWCCWSVCQVPRFICFIDVALISIVTTFPALLHSSYGRDVPNLAGIAILLTWWCWALGLKSDWMLPHFPARYPGLCSIKAAMLQDSSCRQQQCLALERILWHPAPHLWAMGLHSPCPAAAVLWEAWEAVIVWMDHSFFHPANVSYFKAILVLFVHWLISVVAVRLFL